jgi:hypothetical protein
MVNHPGFAECASRSRIILGMLAEDVPEKEILRDFA